MNIGDTFVSNHGRGPLRARIAAFMRDGQVRMYHWHSKRGTGRRVYFTLSGRFLNSPTCGWKPVRAAREKLESL